MNDKSEIKINLVTFINKKILIFKILYFKKDICA